MNLNVAMVIPIYKQSHCFAKVLDGIKKQNRIPDHIIVVLDRLGDDPAIDSIIDMENIAILADLHEKIVFIEPKIPTGITREVNGDLFLAPYMRNEGILLADTLGADIIVLIDGDCIPQPRLVDSHISACDRSNPTISVGRRRESMYRWLDKRESDVGIIQYRLFRQNGLVITDPNMLLQGLVVWSCNMALNRGALDRLYRFNDRYYHTPKHAFCGAFTGSWGGEDTFMGIQAWYCRIIITTIGNQGSGVTHIDHPRPNDKYTIKHMDFVETQRIFLRKKMQINPLPIEFFD